MSRYHVSKLESRGNEPGTGLQACSALDWKAELDARAKLAHTPIIVGGVHYLGYDAMPHQMRSDFLRGRYSYQVIQVAAVRQS